MYELSAATILLLGAGGLLLVSVLFSRTSRRTGLPVTLLFLGVGMVAGLREIGGYQFGDFRAALRLGMLALALILFDGGLNTTLDSVRAGLWPAVVLATVGVALTAAIAGLGAHVFGFPWAEALLIGAVVSSTDAAAVFSALRSSGLRLRRRVGSTLELESGLNDPMAMLLTVALIGLVGDGGLGQPAWKVAAGVLLQLAIGAVTGILVGMAGRWVLGRVHLSAAGLYPVMTVGIALSAFGVAGLLHGSGFLSVYLAGVIIGNGPIRYRTGLLHAHDALAWLSQVSMFLLLGLLVDADRLPSVALEGLGLGLVLAFVARPLAVIACVLPFRFRRGELVYIAWIGLRGAVPIILATLPVLAGTPGARRLFDVVFFIVVVSTVVPGATVRWLTRRLRLESRAPPPPPAVLEITSTSILKGEVMSFFIEPASTVAGATIADLPFPEASSALLIVRGSELVAARGPTVIQPGDHIYVFVRPEDRRLMLLLFGAEEHD